MIRTGQSLRPKAEWELQRPEPSQGSPGLVIKIVSPEKPQE
jgi:hypothetical protein